LIQTQSNLTSILRNPGARSSDLKGWGGVGGLLRAQKKNKKNK